MSEYNLQTIRDLISKAFSSGEVTTLAFDLFYDVYREFAPGMTTSQKIQAIVEKAYDNGEIPKLLDYVKKHNAFQYAQYANKRGAEPSPNEERSQPAQENPPVSLRRLKREKTLLESQWELLSEKVQRLSKELVIETDVTRKFQIEQQLKQAESDLVEIEDKLDDIDQKLVRNRA